MRQAHVLGQVIVRAEAQARDDVEVGITRRKKDDRQVRRHRAQLAAKRKSAVDIVGQADVDQGEVGQPDAKCTERFAAARIRCDFVALLFQHVSVVGAYDGLVLDDGDAAAHGESGLMAIEYTAATGSAVHLTSIVIFSPPFFAAMPRLAPRAVASAAPNGIQTQATWQKGRKMTNGKRATLACLT